MIRQLLGGKLKQGILADLNFQIHVQTGHITKQQVVKHDGGVLLAESAIKISS